MPTKPPNREARRNQKTRKEVKPLKLKWKKVQQESRGAEREKLRRGGGKEKSDSILLASVASTVCCQMRVFQMLEVGEE